VCTVYQLVPGCARRAVRRHRLESDLSRIIIYCRVVCAAAVAVVLPCMLVCDGCDMGIHMHCLGMAVWVVSDRLLVIERKKEMARQPKPEGHGPSRRLRRVMRIAGAAGGRP
jgi:hypothetical protein